jgi:hypothetical protein
MKNTNQMGGDRTVFYNPFLDKLLGNNRSFKTYSASYSCQDLFFFTHKRKETPQKNLLTLSRLKEDIQRMVEDPEMPRPRNRQTLMFSATFPDEIQKMAYAYMAEYLFLTVGIVGGACLDVVQTVHQVSVILGSSQFASTCTWYSTLFILERK